MYFVQFQYVHNVMHLLRSFSADVEVSRILPKDLAPKQHWL